MFGNGHTVESREREIKGERECCSSSRSRSEQGTERGWGERSKIQ